MYLLRKALLQELQKWPYYLFQSQIPQGPLATDASHAASVPSRSQKGADDEGNLMSMLWLMLSKAIGFAHLSLVTP